MMMASTKYVLVFGDQTASFDAGLRRLLQIRENGALVSFLEKAVYALRNEIASLAAPRRELLPRFTNLEGLLARLRDAGPYPAFESALTCMHHLACFISHFEQDSQRYPSPSGSFLIGLCTGQLAAAAISSCGTIAELVPAGLEAIKVAFRVGLLASEVRDTLEQEVQLSQSWAYAVSCPEHVVVAALQKFYQEKVVPRCSQPYISAVTSTTVTVSGPPRLLGQFIQLSSLANYQRIPLSIHSPYHASHLYNESLYLDIILGASLGQSWCTKVPKIPMFSSTTGELLSAPTYHMLLRLVVREILVEQLRWDKILQSCLSILNDERLQYTIYPIATSASAGLALALKSGTTSIVEINDILNKVPQTSLHSSLNNDPQTGRPEQSKIAIIGMSGRFPDSPDPEAFWKVLCDGLDVHRMVPKDRFDAMKHYDLSGKGKNTSRVLNGCWIPEPGLFDARFFSISPREAAQADPGQRLALVTAYEALEQAGFVANRTPSTQRDRVGIFYGMTSDDWREVNSAQNIDTYFIPGGNRAFTPGRINYFFKFSGPSYSVDTACSSSLAAIHAACNNLWRGDCDTALAGGTNVMTNPDNFAGLDRGGFLSHTGNCNTFDDKADGYCRADGVGTVILKRLEDALADNDPIQAVIMGACTNHSAEADSITRPHAGAQAAIFRKVLNEAHVDPNEVSYVEMHGTGTQIGDGLEMESVLSVFAPHAGKRTNPLHLGSAKANVGHAESASGVTSLIKILMMMEKNLIPPHCGIKPTSKINHTFPTDLDQRNVYIASKSTTWTKPEGGLRRVFVNNFSAAGGNTGLLLEDAPRRTVQSSDPRSVHVVAISAKSSTSLMNNIRLLLGYIEKHPNVSLPSLSYTTTARRLHYNYRVAISGSDTEKIKHDLLEYTNGKFASPTIASTMTPHIAFTFTGQGAQYIGMGKQLYENFSQFRQDIRMFDRIAQNQGFPSFLYLVERSELALDIGEIDPQVLQVGTTCLQMALARLWISWGVTPSAVIGHSLGEYAALQVAGVFSASDAIYLTGVRAQLLTKYCQVGTHSMLAVKASVSSLQIYMSGFAVEIACVNSPAEVVISGINSVIDQLSETLVASKIKCTKLKTSFAFHSAQVDPIMKEFETAASGIVFCKPSIPVLSPLTGGLVTDSNVIGATYLSRHCRERVNFLGAIETARDEKLISNKTLWVEIGPNPVCSAFVKAILGSDIVTLPSLRRNEDAWKTVTGTLSGLYLAGVPLQWNTYHQDFKNVEVLPLPSYCWDNKKYWLQYVNDWCLTKGDLSITTVAAKSLQDTPPRLSTTTIHRIIEESTANGCLTITIESDIQRPDLNEVLQSHKVNGTALCPSSAYADIALTLANYLLLQTHPESKDMVMDVCNMTVDKPLIAKDIPSQLFRVTATIDWPSRSTALHFYSVSAEGRKTTDHSRCTVQYAEPGAWSAVWKRNAYFVHDRIEQLRKGVEEGENHRMKRGMAYKIFSSVVNYGDKFQGIEEVVLNSSQLEATARVRFKADEKDGSFYFSPYWIDSLGHLSGFTMNANDAIDSKEQVYINHGWDSMRCSKQFSPLVTYTTYVRMQLLQGNLYAGDVYIMEDNTIVAVYGGVKFQGIPRKLLDSVLPPMNTTGASLSASSKPLVPSVASVPLVPSVASKRKDLMPKLSISTSSSVSITASRVLETIAEELGVEISELTDDTAFADLGLDSLLSLTIIGKLREELDLEVESSLFMDQLTVDDLKLYFSQNESSGQSSTELSNLSPRSSASETYSESSVGTDVDVVSAIRLTLAKEIGVSATDFSDDDDLAELGLDSLMSLKVLSDLRENLSIELDADFFLRNSSIRAIQKHLGVQPSTQIPIQLDIRKSDIQIVQQPITKNERATSVLLQGNPQLSNKKLWLFPDGSGSSISYMTIPKIDDDVAVFGLNCPYLKSPQSLVTCGIRGLTVLYLREVRRRQPHGPYYLGGWSAGGICAYDAAQTLQREGEEVLRLVLIDSPFPIGLEKLPPRLYDFFDSVKLFGEKPPPSWLFPHFLAFVDALDTYKAKAFASGTAPRTHMIWACDGVCKNADDPKPELRDDDPKEMRWLLNNRTDFGPNSWDQLLEGNSIVIETMSNANHFTMMEGRKAIELSEFLERAMK